jgi:hypothetical protein
MWVEDTTKTVSGIVMMMTGALATAALLFSFWPDIGDDIVNM